MGEDRQRANALGPMLSGRTIAEVLQGLCRGIGHACRSSPASIEQTRLAIALPKGSIPETGTGIGYRFYFMPVGFSSRLRTFDRHAALVITSGTRDFPFGFPPGSEKCRDPPCPTHRRSSVEIGFRSHGTGGCLGCEEVSWTRCGVIETELL